MQTNIPHFDNPITSYEKICNAFTEFVDPKETIENLLLELSQKDFYAGFDQGSKQMQQGMEDEINYRMSRI